MAPRTTTVCWPRRWRSKRHCRPAWRPDIMRVAVVGAGIVGVTTAYELAVDGHEVTVFERQASVAAETSFANAGVIAPGYVTPWAAPGMPTKVLRQMFGQHAAVRLARPFSPALI